MPDYIRKPVVFEYKTEVNQANVQARKRARQSGLDVHTRRGWFSWYVRWLIAQDRDMIETESRED